MKWLASNVNHYDYNDMHQLNKDVHKTRNLVEKSYAFEVLQLKILLGLLEVAINVTKLYGYLFLWEIGLSKISHPFLIEYPYFTFLVLTCLELHGCSRIQGSTKIFLSKEK